ncbi:MAG: hypothetical protein SFZ23_04175 [Planctomycetota bacterium]|nr:hypothetical protein [Planctomycetota bacterium]
MVTTAALAWVEALLTGSWWEVAANVVTVVGLPFAILVYAFERRRARQNEEEELYQRLSDEYTNFIKLVLENSDLRLLRKTNEPLDLTPEQLERRLAIFSVLVALFERAYILVYEEKMNPQTARLWRSWEDYIREWCRRPEFVAALADLLPGEDPAFAAHIDRIAREEAPQRPSPPTGER